MAETAPAPATPTKLSGFEQLDSRIEELTSSQGELLARIQKLKLEVHNWRSNLDAHVKTCQNELQEVKQGLHSEMQQLKSEIKEIRSSIQEEKGYFLTQSRNSESYRAITKQNKIQTQDQVLRIDGTHMEEQLAIEA